MKTKSSSQSVAAPAHTKDQRRRLLLLAKLLDRVPTKRFNITEWFSFHGLGGIICNIESARRLIRKECGFAGCAMGWALTSKAIRGNSKEIGELVEGFGFNWIHFGDTSDPATLLFGPGRKRVTPKRVAKDIRAYLKDGTLPTP